MTVLQGHAQHLDFHTLLMLLSGRQLLARISAVFLPACPGDRYCCTKEPITPQGQSGEDRESGSFENNGGKSWFVLREQQEHSHLVQREKEKKNNTSLSCPGVFSNVTFSLCFLCLRVLSFPCVMCQLLLPLLWYYCKGQCPLRCQSLLPLCFMLLSQFSLHSDKRVHSHLLPFSIWHHLSCLFWVYHPINSLIQNIIFSSLQQDNTGIFLVDTHVYKQTLAGVCIQMAALKRTWSQSCLRRGAPWGKPSRYLAKDRNCSSTALVMWTRDDWTKDRKYKQWFNQTEWSCKPLFVNHIVVVSLYLKNIVKIGSGQNIRCKKADKSYFHLPPTI